MDNKNTHIDDAFLKGLIDLSEEEKMPDDLTQKIMASLPKSEVLAPEKARRFNFRNYALIVVLIVAAILLVFNIDFATLLQSTTESSGNNLPKYLSMFTSVFKIFNTSFSGVNISSVSIVAIISLASLYFGDKILKRWFDPNQVEVN